jgi:hypothetical protein
VAHAVEQLRSAPNSGKAPLLQSLKRQPCTSADVCELQRVCVAAYEELVGAHEGVSALERALSGDGAAPPAASAAAALASAEQSVERARTGAQHCADLQATLARRYKF